MKLHGATYMGSQDYPKLNDVGKLMKCFWVIRVVRSCKGSFFGAKDS